MELKQDKDIWVNGNRKYFRLDDGTVMHRPLTVEERLEYQGQDLGAFKLYIAMEENFKENALKVISLFKK